MSFTSSHQARVLFGSNELASKLTNATSTNGFEMLDSTTLADAAKRFTPGLESGNINIEGWFDSDVVTQVYAAISLYEGALGVNLPITYAPAGHTVGNYEILASSKTVNLETGSAVGGLTNWSLTTQGDGYVRPGVSLHSTSAAETADGNGTSVDRNPITSSTLGAVAHLHCTAFSGFSSVAVIVEDSANNSTWATIGTFTNLSAPGFQRLAISGTVRRYVRCSWDVTGTGSITFAVAVAPI